MVHFALLLLVTDPEPSGFAIGSCCLAGALSGNSCRLAGVTGLEGGELLLTGPLVVVPTEDFREVTAGAAAVVTGGPGTVCFWIAVASPFLRWLPEVCAAEAH